MNANFLKSLKCCLKLSVTAITLPRKMRSEYLRKIHPTEKVRRLEFPLHQTQFKTVTCGFELILFFIHDIIILKLNI